MEMWLFHRSADDVKRGYGTEAEAREYLNRLNAGRIDHLYSVRPMRRKIKGRDMTLADELSKTKHGCRIR